MNIPLIPNITDWLWPEVEPGDFLAPELELEVGATVEATATRTFVRRVGEDKFGDAVYRSVRVRYTVVGEVLSINGEDECEVYYYDEYARRRTTGTWNADDVNVIYPAESENAVA
jgi:hypothetical protein